MKNEQILQKAIEKAIKNGYALKCKANYSDLFNYSDTRIKLVHAYQDKSINTFVEIESDPGGGWMENCYSIIFDINFAKAFWGEENLFSYTIPYGKYEGDTEVMQAYEYHLQQMVLSEDPIKYLEKYL